MQVYPSYYKKFKCIGGSCKHNCCIGWEIDIDSDTAALYRTVKGELGERMCKDISDGDEPHFILGEHERCPFLNGDNLCDIIIGLGEDSLCTICAEHPRFHCELPGRTESGIGLSCEEAARVILTEKEPFSLVCDESTDDEIILLRDRLLYILTRREKPLCDRVKEMLNEAGASLPEKSVCEWADVLLTLERLDDGWTDILTSLKEGWTPTLCEPFLLHMADRMTELEQLACYFIYRHFASAPDLLEAGARAAFAALACMIIFSLGALWYNEKGDFTTFDMIELCRLFSSEIEYSDENLYTLFDILAFGD